MARTQSMGAAALCLLLAAPPGFAQDMLLHSIPAPSVGVQAGARFGSSVAVDGPFAVVGAPYDDAFGAESGVVKIFSSTTGAPQIVLSKPDPSPFDYFGWAVAISGTRIVVGVPGDHAGSGNGGAYVFDLGSATPTLPVAILNNPSSATGDHFGRSLAISGTLVAVGASGDDTGASHAGSVHIYDLLSGTPTVPVTTLHNPSPDANDAFGSSMSISGTRVVVGACFDNAGAPGAGSVYVYDLGNGTPTIPVATINNPSPTASDAFGWSVAISGTRVIAGVPFGGAAGRAHVYDLSSGSPTVPVATLVSPAPTASDFGWSVAVSGTRVAVAAPWDAGSAYVYDFSSGTPGLPVAILNNPDPAIGDFFGWSVAISGTEILIGVPWDDLGATDAGSAVVYDLGNGTPTTPVAVLSSPGPAANDRFGSSVAFAGGLMAVSAPLNDVGAIDAGRVYVYDFNSSTPTVPRALDTPDPSPDKSFGASVAISGTVLVVGAPGDGTGAPSAGSAYVYDFSGGGTPTIPLATLNNPNPAIQDAFGGSVAISGNRVVVGAGWADGGATDAGSVYVYDLGSGTPATPVATLDNPNPAAGDGFGWSLATSGTRVVVGASRDDAGATDSGSAYVYDLNSSTPTVPVAILNNPAPAIGDYYGYSVAISGSRVVVGAYLDDTGAIDAGSVYVYDLSSNTPTNPVVALHNPAPAANDWFGFSVAISDTRVIVGARGDDAGRADAGTAYVYDLLSATPALPVTTLNKPGPAAGDGFGYSVAIDGPASVIGTPFDDTVMTDMGFAYVFGTPAPEINVIGNGVDVADGDVTPDSGDHTHFGGVDVAGTALVRTFTIFNTGTADLTLGTAMVSGLHAADFNVSMQPAAIVAPGASTTFQITFDPRANGLRSVTLSFSNNDADENPFDFSVQGTGTGAPPSRVFVAAAGNDANVCSTQTTPCRNLAASIAQVAIDGEVIVLSTGEYDTAPILIGKGLKITSPVGTVAFIRQSINVNAPGGRVALRGLTLKRGDTATGVTLVAADSLSIEDTTLDGWTRGLHIANAAASNVSVTNSVFRSNQAGVQADGVSGNRISLSESRFEGNVTGLDASAGAIAVRGSAFSGNTTAISVTAGPVEITRSELWSNGTALSVLSSGTARMGRSHVFGNTTGLSAAAGGTLESFGSTVIRGNGTNINGTVTTIPEQ